MVHVVAAKTSAHQLLEQVGFFVAALGRAEAGERLGAVLLAQSVQGPSGQIQCFVPGRFAEDFAPVCLPIDQAQVLGHALFADQWFRDAVWAVDVIHAKTTLDAQAAFVGRAFAAFDADDLFIFDLESHQAPHATERAHRIDFAVHLLRAHVALGHERARGTGLNTFAAAHAAAAAHRIGQVKHHLGVRTPKSQADHVVDLKIAAGAFAAVALDAGVQVHGHGGVGQVGGHGSSAQCRQLRSHLHALVLSPLA